MIGRLRELGFLAAAAAGLLAPAPASASESADAIRYPYVAALSRGGPGERVYFCAGALVAPRWIVTAAHCFHDRSGAQMPSRALWAVVGRDRLGIAEEQAQIAVADVYVHPGYEPRSQRNDVALVRLAEVAGPLTVEPARPGAAPPSEATVLGFGSFYEGRGAATALSRTGAPSAQVSDRLRRAAVRLLDPLECLGKVAAEGLCVGARADEACTGDSGAPLVVERADAADLLIGVLSEGTGCAVAEPVAVYTDLAAYRDWMASLIVPD